VADIAERRWSAARHKPWGKVIAERLYLTLRCASFIAGDSESGVRPQAFL
jgi:hypothetical protein